MYLIMDLENRMDLILLTFTYLRFKNESSQRINIKYLFCFR